MGVLLSHRAEGPAKKPGGGFPLWTQILNRPLGEENRVTRLPKLPKLRDLYAGRHEKNAVAVEREAVNPRL